MLSKITFAIVALQASLALAGKAVIANRCPYDIWVWSICTGSEPSAYRIPSRTTHSEELSGRSRSLKVSKSENLVAGKHTQFEYSITDGGQLWYDVSFVDCAKGRSASDCPGHDEGLAMDANNDSCGKLDCPAGQYCPTQAYYVDQPMIKLGIPEPVFMCPASVGTTVDLYMKVCSGEEEMKRSVAGRMEISAET